LEFALAALAEVDLRAGDVGGQEVGRELDSREGGLEMSGEALDRPRLGEPRQSFDQQVAVGQESQEQPLDHRLLADDRFAHSRLEREDGITSAHAVVLALSPGARKSSPPMNMWSTSTLESRPLVQSGRPR